MAGALNELETTISRHLDSGELEGAATAIVRGYGPEIVGYLAALARDVDRAHDVFSQVCEDLWRGLPEFRRDASARTWLYKLAWHAWLRHERDAFRRHGAPLLSEHLSRLAAEVRSATAPYLRTEVKDAVARLREELAPDEQSLLILRVDRGLAWNEIAAVMEAEAPALAKRFERVKAKLRKLAEDAGLIAKD